MKTRRKAENESQAQLRREEAAAREDFWQKYDSLLKELGEPQELLNICTEEAAAEFARNPLATARPDFSQLPSWGAFSTLQAAVNDGRAVLEEELVAKLRAADKRHKARCARINKAKKDRLAFKTALAIATASAKAEYEKAIKPHHDKYLAKVSQARKKLKDKA